MFFGKASLLAVAAHGQSLLCLWWHFLSVRQILALRYTWLSSPFAVWLHLALLIRLRASYPRDRVTHFFGILQSVVHPVDGCSVELGSSHP